MAKTTKPRADVPESQDHGDRARGDTPPAIHQGWSPAPDRPDPVALLAIYQEGADLDQLARQAGGVTFAAMIAAILDREENQPAERR